MTPQLFTISLGLFFGASHRHLTTRSILQSTYNINNVQHNDTLLFDRIALFGMANVKHGERFRCLRFEILGNHDQSVGSNQYDDALV
jgi:hypothetical protein